MSNNRSISLVPNKFQLKCATNLQQNHLKKREETKIIIFNTGSSLMEEERNLAQNEFRKILCSSQVMFPIPP
jgi:hypothetical protein